MRASPHRRPGVLHNFGFFKTIASVFGRLWTNGAFSRPRNIDTHPARRHVRFLGTFRPYSCSNRSVELSTTQPLLVTSKRSGVCSTKNPTPGSQPDPAQRVSTPTPVAVTLKPDPQISRAKERQLLCALW